MGTRLAKRVAWAALAAAGLLAMTGCATVKGAITPESAATAETWIAPKVPESSHRQLVVPVQFQRSDGAELNGYRLTIFDQSGTAVRTIETSAPAPKRTLFGWKVPTVSAPHELVWDGKNDAGQYVSDGAYTYVVEAWGGPGVGGKTEPAIVHVDNSYPDVQLSVTYPFFSPGTGQGQQTLSIRQRDATEAPEWKGVITNQSGAVVRTFTWKDSPTDLVWDGTDNAGKRLPDGPYHYRISATNLAGTPKTIALGVPVVIDTRAKEVSLEPQYPAFSPSGPSPRKTLTLTPSLTVTDEVKSWNLSVYDSDGRKVRTYHGTSTPSPIVFDGRDDDGRVLPDGDYQAVMDVAYKTGADPKAVSPTFAVQSTPPKAVLTAPYRVFAPGQGAKPDLIVDMAAAKDARWTATIDDSSGAAVYSKSWENAPAQWKWDGRSNDGKPLADGSYRLVLSGVDEARNSSSFELAGIRIDSRPGSASLSASQSSFSPNGDEVKDQVVFALGASHPESVASWTVTIDDGQGGAVRHISGNGPWALPSATWEGVGDDHETLADGTYNARLAVEYENGLSAVSDPVSVVLDVTPPKLSVDLSPKLFSPDETSEKKTLSISIGYHDLVPAASYSFRIVDPTGVEFYEFKGTGVPVTPLEWDGRSSGGELVQSAADYPYTLTVQDAAGNTATTKGVIPIDILVIREGDKLRIDVPFINFAPWSAKLVTEAQNPVLYRQTQRVFDQLIPKLQKYPQHKIRIEGHAVMIYWWDKALGEREERDVLIPLSLARAQTVRDVLVRRGIAASRLSVAGLGGTDPIVPFSDLVNRWKDRRVEFILTK